MKYTEEKNIFSIKVKTAVFPVAGIGSRFLPITKAIPKEMLTIIDKPLIQYAVEEALQAGIEKLVFITASGKRAIEDYFDINYELESRLEQAGKDSALRALRATQPDNVTFCYIRQKEPKGLGDAILTAKNIVGEEPFAVLLADDLMYAEKTNVLEQMVSVYKDPKSAMVAVEEIAKTDTEKYGIVAADEGGRVSAIVEKPKPEEAPSQLAVAGRYILPPRIFSLLESTPLGQGGELQITDAIAALIAEQDVNAFRFNARRFDCGSPEGYFRAVIHFAQHDSRLSKVFHDQDVLVPID